MAPGAESSATELRAAEAIGTLCLATDLGMGFPLEHGLQTTLVAIRLADILAVDRTTAAQAYYASLAGALGLHYRCPRHRRRSSATRSPTHLIR